MTLAIDIDGPPMQLLISGEITAGPSEYESQPQLTIDRDRGQFTIRPDPNSLLAKRQPTIEFRLTLTSRDSLDAMGGDELLFTDGKTRRLPYLAIRTRPTNSFSFTIDGSHGSEESQADRNFWKTIRAASHLSCGSSDEKISQLDDTLAWFARDAVVHLSTPRGLEQANGGAWGVRDVCQGSVEFLLAYNQTSAVAEIVRRVFSQQYLRRGDWPQWFMFPPFHQIQSSHAHGDVVIWPIKALCDYLEHSNDGTILNARLPYTDEQSLDRTSLAEPLIEHVDRAIQRMTEQFLPGLSLPRYGDGDWDDSLQPADPMLRDRMVSSWTAQLMYQTLTRYATALTHFGHAKRAESITKLASAIRADFQRHLIPDGCVAGFVIFDPHSGRPLEPLLHPSDRRTGLRYRLIPMSRGILSGIFTPEQATHHLELIREHLLFPDGARLMDRPTRYDGGEEHIFRRSESAAFFGREIGLQYVHAHLRYAEALALMGRADELWDALRVVNPIAVTLLVPGARPRQRNCYFSSSDAAFTDRYQASRDYEKLRRGEIPTDGGWRIYSSGPGIYSNLVIRHLLGIRRYYDWIEFDPVLPRELDGLALERDEDGRGVGYRFRVRGRASGGASVAVDGKQVPSSIAPGLYRVGATRLRWDDFSKSLGDGSIVEIEG